MRPRKPLATAQYPARLTVNPILVARWAPRLRNHSVLLAIYLGMSLLFAVIGSEASLGFLVASMLWVYIVARQWMVLSRHFRIGCVVPAMVVQTNPLTLAAWTDLRTSNQLKFPTVKVWYGGLPAGQSQLVGAHVPCVATYFGSVAASKWDNFLPIPACYATRDRRALARIEQTLPDEEWLTLSAAIRELPSPLAPGLYAVEANV